MAVANLDAELHKLKIDRKQKGGRRGGGGGGFVKALVYLIVIGGLGFGGLTYYNKVNAAIPVKTIRVVAEVAKSGSAPAGSAVLTAGGYVIPRDKIEISSKIIGQVKEINVERGDKVNAGDVILRIDDEEYQAQVKMAESRVASLRAQLAELKAGSRKEEVGMARANVESAEATLTKAEADFKRVEVLAKEKVISQQELDFVKQAFDVAVAAANSAKRNLDMVVEGPRKEQIQALAAQLAEAEANLEFANTQLSYTVITAPTSGTILEKLAKKGELVTNTNFGGTRGAKSSVVSMADLTDLQVELDINENDIPRVKMDQKCEIKLDSNPDDIFEGVVDEISPQADRQKATVQVKVRMLDATKVIVRPEVNARVTFLAEEQPVVVENESEEPKPRIYIPKDAVVGSSVYLVGDGKALKRDVTVGGDTASGDVEITDGLGGGETLILEPLDKITEGVRVSTGA